MPGGPRCCPLPSLAMMRSMDGLENVRIVVPGYAVEYDHIDPRALRSSLELRAIPGLSLVRPADANETSVVWGEILRRRRPTGAWPCGPTAPESSSGPRRPSWGWL